ncbi:ABC transporter substrate-binding protein [Neorhizobium galegae]|uniref:ABC transporter substrate-binding protein n=1 Tax=Neorhizobium galegae TaxID=399 RepID=UPI000622AA21|nr:ABC transporter substrate-binding protein [Neorhizobium galegae]CDZ56838.1 Putative oligogalacturonide ABC transport system periplasmic binding component [Neorhizobium galegae bv. orientalis]KAB1122897.1 carbohydrate ABC transporter substrate-binding protein [Neorhizobium galegae]MCQ1807652.1 ABC transporter substrate-binding protein [Neorhizobium galegae]MCQ1838222.1 ABC transporter substrate-binding protein [Neorhizobium galegae]CDZ62493.1 Putative oligogalacturonide ABC transport system 
MRTMFMTAALFAATSLSTAFASDLRMSWWGSDDRHVATQQALKVCGAKFGHTIAPEFTGFQGHQEKIATQLAGRTEADIMQVNWPWLPLFTKNGDGFADLNQYKDIIDLSQWSKSDLDSGSVKGKLNGISVSTTGRVFMFNKTTYDKAGIPIPKTWEELIAAAPKMKEKLGKEYYPFEGAALDARLMVILRTTQKTGKDLIDPATNKVAWSEAELAEGLEFYKTLVDKGVIESWKQVAAGGNTPLHENQKWAKGQVAGTYQWDSTYGKIATPMEKGQELVPVKLLTIEGAKTDGVYRKPSMLFSVSRNSKDPKAAAQVLNCLLNDPEAVKIMGATRGIPSSKAALDTLTKEGKIKPVQLEAYKRVMEPSSPGVSPLNEHPRVTEVFDTNFEAFAYGQQSSKDAATEIIAGINQALTGI